MVNIYTGDLKKMNTIKLAIIGKVIKMGNMKQKPLKRAHIYWSDALFFLFKVPPTSRNA